MLLGIPQAPPKTPLGNAAELPLLTPHQSIPYQHFVISVVSQFPSFNQDLQAKTTAVSSLEAVEEPREAQRLAQSLARRPLDGPWFLPNHAITWTTKSAKQG